MSQSLPFPHLYARLDRYFKQLMGKNHHPVSLYEPIRYFVALGGKRIRPILVLLTAEAVGGSTVDALESAVAIELLHNFTLVHDDIMDEDDMRRGHPTVHKRWDQGVAILAGDGLIGMAYRILTQKNHPRFYERIRIFTTAVIEVCEGQAMDKEFEEKLEVTSAEYSLMIRKKTASLIAMASQLGALSANGNSDQAEQLAIFGEKIGMAFQIQDDLLDFTSTSKLLGKPVGSDILAGKKTFVTLTANQLLTPNQKDQFKSLVTGTLNENRLKEIQNLLEAGGVLKEGNHQVERYFSEARNLLKQILPQERTEDLMIYTHWILKRAY